MLERRSGVVLCNIVQEIGAEVYIPTGLTYQPDAPVSGIGSLSSAKSSDITFATSKRHSDGAKNCPASFVIVPEANPELPKIQLIHKNPQLAMALLSQYFNKLKHSFAGISKNASVDSTAQIGDCATIYDFAFVGPNAKIGVNAVIYPHCYVGANAEVGANTVLFPSVSVMDDCVVGAGCIVHSGTVIGGDGFGFVPDARGMVKVPQIGNVIIEDDCEIGANCSIDRATFDTTRLCQGVKLDSQVHIGHNVEVGQHTMLCAHVAIGGSAKLGKRVIASGQTGFAPGIQIADGAMFGAQSGVYKPVTSAGEYRGAPHVAARDWMKQSFALERLPELLKRVQKLEKLLEKQGEQDE